ncbi:VOC family protein [Flavobacterium piscis]|uniref:Enzyme related to lactoylglutathione lyase n=1 Tax=Flavobacterium piscis TaxID=1114874 RepID=A0ABU1Y7L0_9FLAO|nr:VOC family protein [Flavobacterium piscis]MDR7210204.1 putative enzyme related to lactoylglutathione lyase [Flavobacterium piscis]
MKFSNIRLLVNDFDKSFTFYKNILGLECTWGKLGDNFASFNIGYPSGLALFKAELMNIAINNAEAKQNEILQDKIAIIVQVNNVNETYNSLQSKGIKFLTEPKDMTAWGIRVTHFRDPENNLIELFSDLPNEK